MNSNLSSIAQSRSIAVSPKSHYSRETAAANPRDMRLFLSLISTRIWLLRVNLKNQSNNISQLLMVPAIIQKF
jgi:hypothetical protein